MSFRTDLVNVVIGNEILSKKIISTEKEIKKNKENFCFAPFFKSAYRNAIMKSSLLYAI